MKVILQQDVPHLGQIGDVVRVKDGYGRNFLVPRGLAVIADDRNVRQLQHLKRVADAKAATLRTEAEALAARLSQTAVTIRREAGEDDKLFGAVTNRDIAAALEAEGITVDRRQIELDEPIKSICVATVDIKVARDVRGSVKVYVIKK